MNGKPLGTSPVSFRDQSGRKEDFTIEIEKDGYEPMTRIITRKWDTAHLTNRLDPIYYYTLNPLPGMAIVSAAQSSLSANKPVPPGLFQKFSDVDTIPAARKSSKERDAVALVIGISRYRDESIPQVRYAKRDAETMASRSRVLTTSVVTLRPLSFLKYRFAPTTAAPTRTTASAMSTFFRDI